MAALVGLLYLCFIRVHPCSSVVKKTMRKSQLSKILAVLQHNRGRFVPMPRLARAATKTGIGVPVHSRIAELRLRGERITCRVKQLPKTGQKTSAYCLN